MAGAARVHVVGGGVVGGGVVPPAWASIAPMSEAAPDGRGCIRKSVVMPLSIATLSITGLPDLGRASKLAIVMLVRFGFWPQMLPDGQALFLTFQTRLPAKLTTAPLL